MSELLPGIKRRDAITDDPVGRYERMVEIRVFEEKVNALFLEGGIHGTTHLCLGQEAVAVGVASAIRPTDWVTCTYRGHGVALALGMEPEVVLGEIMGRLIGSMGGLGGSMHLSDVSVGLLPTFAIIGAGLPVAVGAALTAQVNGTNDIAVAVFGDGATNIGAFHEALNLAAIWNLPVVFVCENNVYGEYSRIQTTTPIDDLADRAASYGFPGVVVDGQDVETVASAMAQAVSRARRGEGPTLLEMKTYRYSGHSRADTAPYRPEGEYDEWFKRDPINSRKKSLIEQGLLSAEGAEEVDARVAARIEAAVQAAQASNSPEPPAMFAHVYAPQS